MHKGLKRIQMIASKSAGAPGTDELAAINAFTLREHAAEELYTRTMYLAHNGVDRDREVIDPALLGDFVKTLPGKGLFVKHPMGWDGDTGPGEGRFYKASVVEMSHDEARAILREPNLMFMDARAHLLEASFYMVKTSDNASLISKIDAGVAGDVSIGFSHSDSTPIKDASDNVIAQRLPAPGYAYEGSLVWLGAQPGARVFKQATFHDEDTNMDYKKAFEDLQVQHNDLTAKAAGFATVETELNTIKTALGTGANIEQLKAHAELGKKYHAKLVDDVSAAERVAGLVPGDDAKSVAEAKALLADWSVERLEKYLARVTLMGTKGAQLGGGDPNTTGAGAHTKAAENSPLANKAVTG